MDIKEALTIIGEGHIVWKTEYAREVCKAFGVSFPESLIQPFKNEPHALGYHGEGADGVYSLTLSHHVAKSLGVEHLAYHFSGRGSQAQEYARVVEEKLKTA